MIYSQRTHVMHALDGVLPGIDVDLALAVKNYYMSIL